MSTKETTKAIVKGVIARALQQEGMHLLMEPDIDQRITIIVANKLSMLQECFRIEAFRMPEVEQDKKDPTVLKVFFSYVPSREFDWTQKPEWIKMMYKLSTVGTEVYEGGTIEV